MAQEKGGHEGRMIQETNMWNLCDRAGSWENGDFDCYSVLNHDLRLKFKCTYFMGQYFPPFSCTVLDLSLNVCECFKIWIQLLWIGQLFRRDCCCTAPLTGCRLPCSSKVGWVGEESCWCCFPGTTQEKIQHSTFGESRREWRVLSDEVIFLTSGLNCEYIETSKVTQSASVRCTKRT